MVFVPMAQAPPKAGSKDLLYRFRFRRRQLLQVRLGKLSYRSTPLWTSVFFRHWASNKQDSPKASPRAIFNWQKLDIKNFIEPLKPSSQWMTGGESWMPTCTNMRPYIPAWANIAVCQLCRDRQPLVQGGTVMMGLNWKCLDQCHGVRSHGKSSSQSWRKTVVQSKFDPWVHILALFSPKVIYAGLPAKAFPRNQAFVDISVFLWLRKQRPSFAQGQPKGYFQLKEPHRTTKKYSQMNADWNWRRPSMLSSMCQDVARLQFDSSSEKDSLCGTVMMGLNWKCLDQCHGVRSHGKSSSQDWRKIVVQSKFDPWVHILVFAKGDICRFACKSLLMEAGLCRHQFFSAVAQGTAKTRPRVIFNWKNFIEQLKLILKWMLIESWRRLNMRSSVRKHVTRLQFDRCAEKDSPCGTVMMARITSVFY